jgi:HlyD family secretion protein
MKTIQTPELVSIPAPDLNAAKAPEQTRKHRRYVLFVTVILAAAAVALAISLGPNLLRTPPEDVIRASGRIEARQVSLAPKEIQARVKRLFVDEGAAVNQGQLLAELESSQLEARLASLEANVANFDAQIRQASIDLEYTNKSTNASIAAAEAAVGSAESRIERAQAVLVNSSLDYERARGLWSEGIIPKSTLDQTVMANQTSQADRNAAEKELLQAKANLAVALASKDTLNLKTEQIKALRQTRRAVLAQVAEANANLAERRILAPISGTILSRPVEVGDVVSPGTTVFVLVDMHRLYLKVYIPEPDIPKVKLGDQADVTVDAFPGRSFPGRVTKIYEQAEFTPKNVETADERVKLVFGVELTLLENEGLLKPGMPADGAIHWKSPDPEKADHER